MAPGENEFDTPALEILAEAFKILMPKPHIRLRMSDTLGWDEVSVFFLKPSGDSTGQPGLKAGGLV